MDPIRSGLVTKRERNYGFRGRSLAIFKTARQMPSQIGATTEVLLDICGQHRRLLAFLGRLRWLRILRRESVASYADLPLVCVGHSKELRRTVLPGILIGRFLPTLYSYTSNRAGIVAGTDTLRMKISRIFWRRLHNIGVNTCYLVSGTDLVLVSEQVIPPIEVIVKRALVGTSAHIYDGLFKRRDRFDRPFVKGERHPSYVRFDYRNPLTSRPLTQLRGAGPW